MSRLCAHAKGNESKAKISRFRPSRILMWTIYHCSVILRSFRVESNAAKRDANGFFKVLLLSLRLLNSRHPVRKSKFGTCAVTGYCSFTKRRARKPYRIWLLFTHNNGDFGAISVTEGIVVESCYTVYGDLSLNKQNNNFVRAAHYFTFLECCFFAFTAELRREIPKFCKFTFYGVHSKQATLRFSLSLWT